MSSSNGVVCWIDHGDELQVKLFKPFHLPTTALSSWLHFDLVQSIPRVNCLRQQWRPLSHPRRIPRRKFIMWRGSGRRTLDLEDPLQKPSMFHSLTVVGALDLQLLQDTAGRRHEHL